MKNIALLFCILLIINGCGVQPIPDGARAPKLRIGILEDVDEIAFQAGDNFEVYSSDGALLATGGAGDQYEIRLIYAKAARIDYYLAARKVTDDREAQKIASDVRAKGYPSVIKEKTRRDFRAGQIISQKYYYICIDRAFDSKESAIRLQNDISDEIFTIVETFYGRLPSGILQLSDKSSNRSLEARNFIRLSGNNISINARTGAGFHYESRETRTYEGDMIFIVNESGQLTVMNEIPIANYLAGVISAEMSPGFPLEALKAQTITARSYTLSRIGKQHPLAPFDLCDEVHCQVFKGITNINAATRQAVRETAGQVLMYEDEICETFYAGVCGGHTEHNENVWNGNPRRYLRGIFDMDQYNVRANEDFLKNEENLSLWIDGSPDVYCNLDKIEVPSYLEYARKYFRWDVTYSQNELSELLLRNTGTDFGDIINIVPVERGISGRLKTIRIEGSRNAMDIDKELEIRKALSENYLYSSCFQVERKNVVNGIPREFTLHGAGWGHGVGMCQTGAAVMALQGINYKRILSHYYRESDIRKLY